MSDEAYEYLQPGFDPKSLTVPRLRSILVAHDVQYPATAKKPQLIDIFNEGVVPKAKKFLDKQARAKRSSMGIINMPRGDSYDTASFDDEDVDLAPPPRRETRSRSPRKASARLRSEDYEDEPALPLSPTKRKVRGASRQLSHPPADLYPTEAEPPRSVRRSTRTVTPQVKVEDVEDGFFNLQETDVNFSAENPFQSGSSPAPASRPSSSRRRTAGHDTPATFNDVGVRRRTDGYERPKSAKSNKSVRHEIAYVSELDAGEEFTPEEQIELEMEIAMKGANGLLEQRRPKPAKKRTGLRTPLMALAVTLLGAYGGWYRQEKIAVGYCGLGRPATQVIPPEVSVPDWIVPYIEPQCERCPQHAYCFEDYTVRCDDNFILKPHPLSLGGLVPLPPTCEPDGEKVRRIKAVADKAVEELRERRAQFECGELVDQTGEQEESPAIEEEELKSAISEKRSKKMNKQEFDDLWAAAIGDIKDREEVEIINITNQIGRAGSRQADSAGLPNTYLSSTSLARLSISCAAKRSLRLGLARYRLPAGSLAALVALYFYLRGRYRSHKAEVSRVPSLVDLVLARLASQKELGEEELDDPWLFLPNLRDDVLRSVHSLKSRDRIWSRVRAVVEQNSNVRTSQREGRSGEVGRAWEWIGPLTGDSARRRKSGRVSFGTGAVTDDDRKDEMSEKSTARSTWQESRPIY
ncbi:inner nuclear membrane protein enriched at telomere/subtelomere region [Verticillium nonalfalfae]|uniref:Inner nuclear membrane protein enriched at telomere/subtelomere region n=1 Tax=Verticillium nonalfalfae TaxID=1051616 RepID=A0A3M9YKL2_9PEZI|nr:inner nuclear membrane protein enriched at telomere/subtelomere region [Verticillium nonalfalfae]RNJ60765.1 inner nuclear membrane protein enriched at telomere/subtelomere region [Verticillium nonalfalfae]